MCLYNPKKIEVKTPITCYKILRKDLKAPIIVDYQYRLNEIHISKIRVTYSFESSCDKITSGFHSCRTFSAAEIYKRGLPKLRNYIIAECTIPVDSVVYEGNIYPLNINPNYLVSDQIIINRIVSA